MGYFDGLAAASFKTDESGRTLYFPWGRYRPGYVVESAEQAERLRRALKRELIVALVSGFLILNVFGLWPSLALVAVYALWRYFRVKAETKGLARSTEKLTYAEAFANMAAANNWFFLFALAAASMAFVIASIWMVYRQPGDANAYLGLAFFGFCAIFSGLMLAAKARKGKTQP